MTNTRKYILIGSSAITIIAFVWIMFNRSKKKKEIAEMLAIFGGGITDPAVVELPEGRFPLKFGDKNLKIAKLQKVLNKKYNSNLDIDGKFGQSTADVLCKKFFPTCQSWLPTGQYQARQYEISQIEYDTLNQ